MQSNAWMSVTAVNQESRESAELILLFGLGGINVIEGLDDGGSALSSTTPVDGEEYADAIEVVESAKTLHKRLQRIWGQETDE